MTSDEPTLPSVPPADVPFRGQPGTPPAASGGLQWGMPPEAPAGPDWAAPPTASSGPEWAAPPPPWSAPPPPPPTPGAPPSEPPRPSWPMQVGAVIAVVLAAMTGIAIGRHFNLHGSRPTLSDSPVSLPSVGAGNGGTGSGGGFGFPGSPQPTAPGSAGSSGSIADPSAVASQANRFVVDINTMLGYQNGAAAGTGMILTSTGEILTNNHVIDGATSITATVVSTGRTYRATVVGTDPTDDVAVLQLQGASGLPTITTGTVSVGDPVVAVGNAGGAGGTPSVVTGTVQALHQTITASDNNGANAETLTNLIQTDAALQPGDSGGPMLNGSAQVVGMDTAASSGRRFSGSGAGYAIPIADALNVAKQIEGGQASSKIHIGLPGFLGVSVVPGSTGGAQVAGVASGTPAASIGLAQGDVITAVDGTTIPSAEALSTALRAHHPGDRVSIRWTDTNGSSHSRSVVLATGPAD